LVDLLFNLNIGLPPLPYIKRDNPEQIPAFPLLGK
jgi:hypothetical protein